MTANSDFLYPFIDAHETDASVLLADLAQSARTKATASAALREATLSRCSTQIAAAASATAERIAANARLFVFGNGGSSTDAASLARLFANPPWGRPVASRALVEDSAILTALANDVGFDLVFARQIIAHGRRGDIAIGMSTSGSSRNVLTALATAVSRGMLTIGFTGYNGGEMATSGHVLHCLVVDADSVHRIQETQAAVGFELWTQVQHRLAENTGVVTSTSGRDV